MSWTDDQLDTLRTRMVEAKRQGAWISAAEARIVLEIIRVIRRLTMAKGWSGVASGRLPTVADTKAQGVTALHVTCNRPGCGSRRRFAFSDLPLDDRMVFIEIPRHVRFRCRRCRGRDVSLMADWPDPIERQRNTMVGDERPESEG